FPDNPVLLVHASGHLSVANSYALRVSGVNKNTPDPDGGQIVRDANTGEATGLLLERGRAVLKINRKELTLDEELELVQKQQDWYASHGITTAQEGSTGWSTLSLLREAAQRGLLK